MCGRDPESHPLLCKSVQILAGTKGKHPPWLHSFVE